MRKLAAALACRINGTRLYGKPLHLLDIERRISVLGHIVALLRTERAISDIVLGVSAESANQAFHEIAAELGLRSIRGDERDVLQRLIQCAEAADATDVFRVTTESPFTYFEAIQEAWDRHLERGNDVTVIDGLPDGCNFEIFTVEALRLSHRRGDDRHRSEMCSLYIREHRHEFAVEVVPVPNYLQRDDLRLTIDYPEDLVVCRGVYEHLREHAPRIPLESIVSFLDAEPALKAMVAPYASSSRLYS